MTPYFIVAKGHNLATTFIKSIFSGLEIRTCFMIFIKYGLLTLYIQRGFSLTSDTTFDCGQRPQFVHNIYKVTERLFIDKWHHIWLWAKATIWPQHLYSHREAIHLQVTPHFIVAKGHNIYKVTERLFIDKWHHISLWPKATKFINSQRGYSLATMKCGVTCQWIASLWLYKCGQIMAIDHKEMCHL